MNTKFIAALLIACIQCSRGEEATAASQPCEDEIDLDFVTCTLVDLSDTALRDICQRIGLDSETDVLSYLFRYSEDAQEGDAERTYSHSDFVKAAEECLSIDSEMDGQQPERNELQQDPEILITDILIEDEKLLKEIVTKLREDRPELVEEIKSNGIMVEAERLEDRPDIVGFYLASMLSEDPSRFTSLFSEKDLSRGDKEGCMKGCGVRRPNLVRLQRTHLRH